MSDDTRSLGSLCSIKKLKIYIIGLLDDLNGGTHPAPRDARRNPGVARVRDSQFPFTPLHRHIRAGAPFAVRPVCPRHRHSDTVDTVR